MLKLIDLIKEYKVDEESVLALHGVSIQFRRNEFVSILGPSGCGKTTLLNIVGGLDQYTSGDIVIDGISTKEYDDGDWDTYRNHRIGFIFQSYNLIPHMNILKNVAMSLTLAGVSSAERKERAMEALKKVGLDSQARKKPNQLSGGQMQRVAIARALVNDPEIILADEPTGALDSESGIQVMELLKEVAKDRLVIMVTHNPQLAEEYSTRIVSFKDGEVVGDTMPYDEATDPEAIAYYEKLNANRLEQIHDYESKHGNKKLTKGKIRALKNKMAEKSSMSLKTAISLSFTNLISKKGRTFLTSLAGSIGIIGIILVLAASSGVSGYVHSIEENALSKYPITITESNMDIESVLNILMPEVEKNFPKTNKLEAKRVLGNLLKKLPEITSENDLRKLKAYIEDEGVFNDEWGQVKYDYGTNFNVFSSYAYEHVLGENRQNQLEVEMQEDLGWKNALASSTGGGYIDSQKRYKYEKIYPFTDVMGTMFKNVGLESEMGLFDAAKQFADKVESWDEISTNQELLNNQYDVLDGRWPDQKGETKGYNEIVLVVDENNQVPDYALFMLGLIPGEQVKDMMFAPEGSVPWSKEFSELIKNVEYKVASDAEYLYKTGYEEYELANSEHRNRNFLDDIMKFNTRDEFPQEGNINYIYLDETSNQAYRWSPEKEYYEIEGDFKKVDGKVKEVNHADAVTVKIVGVVRPKRGVNATSINGLIGYTKALTEAIITKTQNHPVVKKQIELYQQAVEANEESFRSIITIEDVIPYNIKTVRYYDTIVAGSTYPQGLKPEAKEQLGSNKNDIRDKVFRIMMREVGYADLTNPLSISFYCSSFHAKDNIIKMLDNYNATNKEDEIKYTDYLAIMMGYVSTLTDVVTYVLIGFSSISLLVSTIMIGIIIYTSVLERRKEIGVLRSLGARKKDISRVFIAESSMIGAYSGAIGVVISGILSVIISVILKAVFGIPNLLLITWWHCLLMIAISIILSIIAGYIPSRMAANKDPATALRSE